MMIMWMVRRVYMRVDIGLECQRVDEIDGWN